MGRIFGISNLPVSTIMTPFESVKIPHVTETDVLPKELGADKFVSRSIANEEAFVGMKGRLGIFKKALSKIIRNRI